MEGGEFVLNGGAEEDDALLLALRTKAAQAKQRRAGRGGNNKDEGEAGAGGEEGAAGPRREVRQPRDIFDVPVEDDYTKPLWIQLNTHDLLSFYELMHHAVHKECTPASCPKMSAGPNFEFLWSEGEYNAKPAALSATEYIAALVQWARKLTDEFHLDPADEAAFKKTYRLIWSRSFRIAMHLYWHHWQELTALKLDALLNAFTKHFVIFALKFRLLTSWDSVSAIYDLLSSILPSIYASQLRDLRDGKKRTRAGAGPARRAKEARALPVGRRRAYTEWDDRGAEPDSLARAASPPPTEVIPTAVAAAELKVEEATKPELTSVEEKKEEKNEEEKREAESEEEEGDGGDTEHVGGREEKGGSTTKSKTSGKKEKRKGSKAKKSGGGSSQHKKGATAAKEEASPLKAGLTLEGIQSSSSSAGKNLPGTTTGSGDSGRDGSSGGSGRGSRTTSPRLVVDDDRRQKGSRIQMSKEDFIRELQRQKEAKLQPGGASPLASPRSPKGTVPASLSASPPADRRLSVGDSDDARSRTSTIELPEPVRRFFTPPGSPRPEAASPPLSPTATPTSPMSPRSETGSPLSPAARRLTTAHHAATAPAGLRYPTIPPSFDVAKAMADLAALDQECADFEEIHMLEQKLLSARSETAAGTGGGNNALADLFELANGRQAQQGKEKAGSGDDEEEGIYSLLSPRKYAKRPSVINQKEFDELRLQLVEQEKKRSRTWVTKRTSLPRNMQELKGSYIRDPLPPQAGTLKKDFVTRPS